MLAAQRALDQVQRGLHGSDTGPQPRRLTDEAVQRARARTGRLLLALPLFVTSGTAP
ncbi:hypothetical protein [Streptomyces atratus]|uniref:hypothetical protein n=1 Tax=Streptomyces atratus TaxID=1893 RepID=UPI002255199A|nr:hypothetical protein [Streptomyces atratus]MCX5342863.1 hypothetical protein [Streptomyces atratus]